MIKNEVEGVYLKNDQSTGGVSRIYPKKNHKNSLYMYVYIIYRGGSGDIYKNI